MWGTEWFSVRFVYWRVEVGEVDILVLCPRGYNCMRSFFVTPEVYRWVLVLGPVVQGTSGVIRVTYFMLLHCG